MAETLAQLYVALVALSGLLSQLPPQQVSQEQFFGAEDVQQEDIQQVKSINISPVRLLENKRLSASIKEGTATAVDVVDWAEEVNRIISECDGVKLRNVNESNIQLKLSDLIGAGKCE